MEGVDSLDRVLQKTGICAYKLSMLANKSTTVQSLKIRNKRKPSKQRKKKQEVEFVFSISFWHHFYFTPFSKAYTQQVNECLQNIKQLEDSIATLDEQAKKLHKGFKSSRDNAERLNMFIFSNIVIKQLQV